MTLISREKHFFLSKLEGFFRGNKWLHFLTTLLQYSLVWSTLPLPKPSNRFVILSTITHQILLETIPTWNHIICSISLSSFLLQSFHLPPSWSSLTVGMAVVKVCCGLKVEGAFIFYFIFSKSLPPYLHCTSTRMDLMAATPTPLSALQ